GDPPVEGVVAIAAEYGAALLDLDEAVPGVVDEGVAALVGGGVAVTVVNWGGQAADRGDLVLLVCGARLRRPIRRRAAPVAQRIEGPTLTPAGTRHRVRDAVAVSVGESAAGERLELVERVVAVARPVGVIQLIEAVVDLVGAVQPVAVTVVAVLE